MNKALLRDPVKTVRDRIKRDYKKTNNCYICDSDDFLELHHLYSISELFNNWVKKEKIDISTTEKVVGIREEFYEKHFEKLSPDNCITLCKTHHERLHHLYGQRYTSVMVPKIRRWLNIQKEKVANEH